MRLIGLYTKVLGFHSMRGEALHPSWQSSPWFAFFVLIVLILVFIVLMLIDHIILRIVVLFMMMKINHIMLVIILLLIMIRDLFISDHDPTVDCMLNDHY